jgi:hypothetical protein
VWPSEAVVSVNMLIQAGGGVVGLTKTPISRGKWESTSENVSARRIVADEIGSQMRLGNTPWQRLSEAAALSSGAAELSSGPFIIHDRWLETASVAVGTPVARRLIVAVVRGCWVQGATVGGGLEPGGDRLGLRGDRHIWPPSLFKQRWPDRTI